MDVICIPEFTQKKTLFISCVCNVPSIHRMFVVYFRHFGLKGKEMGRTGLSKPLCQRGLGSAW